MRAATVTAAAAAVATAGAAAPQMPSPAAYVRAVASAARALRLAKPVGDLARVVPSTVPTSRLLSTRLMSDASRPSQDSPLATKATPSASGDSPPVAQAKPPAASATASVFTFLDGEEARLAVEQARRYDAALAKPVFRGWCEALVAISRPVAGNHVLDVATGTGVNAFILAEIIGNARLNAGAGEGGSGGRVLGVDVSDGMLEVARSKSPPPGALTPEFVLADKWTADLGPQQSFDRAYCHQVGARPGRVNYKIRSAHVIHGSGNIHVNHGRGIYTSITWAAHVVGCR